MKSNLHCVFYPVIIFIFILIIIFISWPKDRITECDNLKIIDIPMCSNYLTLMWNLFMVFGDIFIVNGSLVHKKKLTLTLETKLPFISPVITNQDNDTVLVSNYKCVVNGRGDFVFLDSGKIGWNKTVRKPDEIFLTESYKGKGVWSSIIVTEYEYKQNKACHFNYIVKKIGYSVDSIKSFIKTMNAISTIIKERNIVYFSIAGNSNTTSARRNKILKYIFKDSYYVSPGVEDKFITDKNSKHGACSPRFILVSKTLAPCGVYFYLSRQRIDYFSTSHIIVAEILKEKKVKSKYDDTENIYNNFLTEKEDNASLRLENETDDDVDLSTYNLEETSSLIPFKN